MHERIKKYRNFYKIFERNQKLFEKIKVNSEISIESINYLKNQSVKIKSLLTGSNLFQKIAVIGNFSSGKSSFLNSLFKKEVCPVSVEPTTSSITKFIPYDSDFIINDFENKLLNIEEYNSLVKHKSGNTSQTRYYDFSYYSRIDTLEDCIVYDTPGLNNPLNENDEMLAFNVAKEADLIFFIIDIEHGDIRNDFLESIEEIREKNPDHASYLIINKADLKSFEESRIVYDEIKEKYDKIFDEIFLFSSHSRLYEGNFERIMDIINKNKIKKIKMIDNYLSLLIKKFLRDRKKILRYLHKDDTLRIFGFKKEEITMWKCEYCGFENEDIDQFCANCGGQRKNNDEVIEMPAIPEPPVEIISTPIAVEPVPAEVSNAVIESQDINESISKAIKIVQKVSGKLTDNEFVIDSEVVIGRFTPESGPVDIDLGDIKEAHYISRKHAKIFFDESAAKWNIVDLDSTNGVFVNRTKLQSNVPGEINPEDEIALGNAIFIVKEL